VLHVEVKVTGEQSGMVRLAIEFQSVLISSEGVGETAPSEGGFTLTHRVVLFLTAEKT